MDLGAGSPDGGQGTRVDRRRLDSWKEIAAYLGRDVKTAQRWEKREGLPVHRHQHDRLGSVHAFADEVDAWREGRRRAQSDSGELAAARLNGSPRRRLPAAAALGLAGAALGVTAVVTFSGWIGARESSRAVRFVIQPAPIESFTSLAVSPDGLSVAYNAGATLHNRRLDSAHGNPVPGTESAYEPFWSHDGRQLAFFAERDLRVVDAQGGTPRVLCAARRGVGGTWNQHGTIVFSAELGGVLYRVSVDSGQATPIRKVNPALGQQALRWPHFLPDGERFVYLVRSYRPEIQGLYLGSLSDPTGKGDVKILDSQSNAVFSMGHILSVQSGTLMATPFDATRATVTGESRRVANHVNQGPYGDGFALFSASRNGVLAYKGGRTANRQLRWFDRTGRLIGRVGPADEYRDFELSHDDSRVAVVKLDPQTGMQDVWIHDFGRGSFLKLTSNLAHDGAPVWSPDDARIVYGSTRDGRVAVYETLASGVGPERHIFTGPAIPFDWSPDSRRLALQLFSPKGQTDVVFADLASPRPQVDPYVNGPSMEGEPQFAPNGRWMAYSSSESGSRQVFVEPIPRTGERWQVSSELGREPRWQGDGAALYFLGPDNLLMAATLQTSAGKVSPGPLVSLFKLRVTDRDVKHHYDVGRDGTRFLVNTLVEDTRGTPIQVSVNWNHGVD